MNGAKMIEEGLIVFNDDKGFWHDAKNWLVGIDLKVADEEIEEAFDAAFKNEEREHSEAVARIDGMFKDVEGAGDSAEKFVKWQEWWQEGLKEFQRHEEKMEMLTEAKARVHLAAYIRSQPFFIRPMLDGAVERVSGGCRK